MAVRSFPVGVLRQASPMAGFRLMGTRCQAKETREMLASLESAMKETPVLASEHHLLQGKTSRDLERLMKSASYLRKAGDAFLVATILGVPLLLLMGSKDRA